MTPIEPSRPTAVTVRAPGKINLALAVGRRRDDGFHPLATVFQAVSVYEDVTATAADGGPTVTVAGVGADQVPTDASNLAVRAAVLLAEAAGVEPDVHLHLHKGVPVAGGMAGGSADAAATLVACDALWRTGMSRDALAELGAVLGSDVPFALLGHTAVGRGRGDLLTPALSRGQYHWALGLQRRGLSTPTVFARFDERVALLPDPAPAGAHGPHGPDAGAAVLHLGADRADRADRAGRAGLHPEPEPDRALLSALRAADLPGVGRALTNDLEPAAVDLAPHLEHTLAVAREAGALGVLVSGSGPTVAALARNRVHALAIAAALMAAGAADDVLCAAGPVPGARILVGDRG